MLDRPHPAEEKHLVIDPGPSPRRTAAAILVCLALALLPFFYGMPVNAIVLAGAVLLLLTAVASAGPDAIARALARDPWPVGLAVYTLLVLMLNYQWSASRDTSFAPTWSLAMLPITFLVTSTLGRLRWRVFAVFVGMAMLFSAFSLWMTFRHGFVAAAPLTDPNNLASLLYLALVPTAWLYVRRVWDGRVGAPGHALALSAFAVVVSALFATQSRAGAVIVGVALGVFLVVGISRRRRLWPVLAMMAIAAGAYPLVQLALESASPFAAEDMSRGMGVRMALNRVALQIFLLNPVTGAGVNMFPLLYRQMRDPIDQSTAGISAHNDYLQLLAEGGVLLVLPLVVLAAATAWRFARVLWGRRLPDSDFGVIVALGAVLAHALVNFVLMTPLLAVVIGLAAALVCWGAPRPDPAAPAPHMRWGARALLAFGWLSFGYLLLDCFSLGVYQRQPGIPFVEAFNRSPEGVLAYSRFAQSLNANRGLPVLAEAAVYRMRFEENAQSSYLRDLTLHTYRRAIATDPWNPYAFLAMYDFVKSRPELAQDLAADEQPMQLLLRSLELDPIFLPALDALRAEAEASAQPEVAFRVVRERLGPWLVWLARSNPQDADRWLAYLRDWGERTGDREFLSELEVAASGIARIERHKQLRIWFD